MRNAGGGGVSGFGMSKSPIGMLKGAQHGVMPCLLVKNVAILFARLSMGMGGPGLSHAPSGSGKGGFSAYPW